MTRAERMLSVEIILTTYNATAALERCLASVGRQDWPEFSICVADDGSGPETRAVIEAFQATCRHPVRHVWHEDRGFEKCAILNRAIASSQADFLVFIDGDVLIFPDFIRRHVAVARRGQFATGSLVRLDAEATAAVTVEDVASGRVFTREWLKAAGRLKGLSTWLKAQSAPAWLAGMMERLSPVRRSFCGANASAFRADVLAVNGFDERLKYGGLDKEFGERLKNRSIKARHLRYSACLLHLDHPRGYDKPEIRAFNRGVIAEVRKGGRYWTDHGIRQPGRATLPAPGGVRASVIVPTFRDWDVLQKCLDGLAAQSLPAAEFEIILANNNPVPDVPADLRLPANARVLHVPKPGSYAARNAALDEARGEVLFFTDSDCQPQPGWIAAGLRRMEGLGPGARLAGRVELYPAVEGRWTAAELFDRVFWLRQADYVRHGWGATANMCLDRRLFDSVGPFNADLYSGGDREWNLRASALGSPILYEADMCVRHPARPDFAALAKKRRRTLGGAHRRQILQGRRKWWLPLHFLLPSLGNLARVLREPDLTLIDRSRVFATDYRLRLVSFHELARLRLFGAGSRRS